MQPKKPQQPKKPSPMAALLGVLFAPSTQIGANRQPTGKRPGAAGCKCDGTRK